MTTNILIAGFGGQGILFAGKFLAYQGLIEGKELSWLPSYGPEMRGGTANCSVIIGDEPVGSPIVSKPDILMVMNLPSLDKYEKDVVPGGTVIVDSTLIERKLVRDDVKAVYIPATAIAKESGHPTLANIILVGKMIRETGVVDYSRVEEAMKKVVSAKHPEMFKYNMDALAFGYNYESN